ncbi:MAG: M48 family metalloprotease [Burkholderiales bacterium]
MDFFEQQAQARRASRWLVVAYLLSALFVVASFNLAAALGYSVLAFIGLAPLAPTLFHLWVTGVVGGIVLGVSAWRIWKLSEGGPAMAELLGARYLSRSQADAAESRLLNVVEEMAIASGVAVPPVYVLLHDDAINAMVAGHSPNEAVIIVTRGLAQKLTRDELQGVMGHEFSHLLNGDMVLNIRLAGLLGGLTWFGEAGEKLVWSAAAEASATAREDRGGEVFGAIAGALIAFIGFPGSFAAQAIKAAISRKRELLADAASVQFTRNPDAIAGALDAVSLLHAGTTLRGVMVEKLSHMFFLPAFVRWWGFPTHPPIEERIRTVNPGFRREEYRRTRPGARTERSEVAVLDGQGNVVEVLGAAAAIALAPTREHIDYARRLLGQLPAELKTRLGAPEGAAAAMIELLQGKLAGVPSNQALLLIDLALPALKEWPQARRDAFLADVDRTVAADGKVTLREFVESTILRQRLREGAGKPIRTQFRKVAEVAADARAAISLVAHLSTIETSAAYAQGRKLLGLEAAEALPLAALTPPRLAAALERLRVLDPFEKPRVLKACVATAAADGKFRLAEMELVRAVAATLDCPVPPVIGALDPATLPA